ncbi:hypothetical protein AF953_02652 [Listeria monocytogenes]|nr:hypothetical protein AFY32_01176 [Listeria monocytogenes]RKA90237.1 hypothetical protein AFX66_01292 [Listeria monocytogenes]RKC29645.1 hypothetical protein AF953_02652 [Listeria monocytogenes]
MFKTIVDTLIAQRRDRKLKNQNGDKKITERKEKI